MKTIIIACTAVLGAVFSPVFAASGNEAIRVTYEMPNFVDGVQLGPGIHLNAPGDSYRYTFIIDDEYSNDPSDRIEIAQVGVHILDTDWNSESGDAAPEWGRILINGQTQDWVHLDFLEQFNYRSGETPSSSALYEIEDDNEVGTVPLPPYIFDVTTIARRDRGLTIEVINLRQDGSMDSDAPFGDFDILRIGFAVTWKKLGAITAR
jgi:hypothetical protein